jgi:hypothetical protein
METYIGGIQFPKRKDIISSSFNSLKAAERERFELSEGITPSTVFETVPFNHSGISPF